ncbi:MAG: DsbE family thiol:disulfide interchange protein [Kistimonas sp.]|nr:DsbE family thiol:disulfide interchange protein [Kistimonas sp.]
MKRWLLFLPLLAFIGLGAFFLRELDSDHAVPSALVSHRFPDFSAPLLSLKPQQTAQTANASALKGQISLVNVWASWCPSCAVEHPFLMKLARQKVPLFGVNYKDQRDRARQWLEKRGNPYRMIFVDEKGLLGIDLGVRGAPETFLVDAKGVIRYKHEGVLDASVWNDELVPLVAQLRAEQIP